VGGQIVEEKAGHSPQFFIVARGYIIFLFKSRDNKDEIGRSMVL
jgi:hypothetical protein